MNVSIDELTRAVAHDSAVRRNGTSSPPAAPRNEVFPPTYPGDGQNASPVMSLRPAAFGGHGVRCILIDRVQSQANC
jgi:CRISPR-associated protein Csb1